jgi:hypothetical protein
MMVLPPFDEFGLLPPGDYALTLEELKQSTLVTGPSPQPEPWDSAWRAHLVDNLSVLLQELWATGITEIFVDGSFVEDKAHPNDIDGYFECELMSFASGELQRRLNLLNTHKIWTWEPQSRRPYHGSTKLQLPMWHVYRVELYPHWGQLCGIHDEHGHELEFPSAFRRSRQSGRARGIVKIER